MSSRISYLGTFCQRSAIYSLSAYGFPSDIDFRHFFGVAKNTLLSVASTVANTGIYAISVERPVA